MSSSSCNTFSQMDLRCENGEANIYKKDVTIVRGEWVLYSEQECCDCSASSSSGSSASLIQTDCCENPVPSTLSVTVTNSTGCTCVGSTTFSLIYNSGTSQWEGSNLFGSCGSTNIQLAFYCVVVSNAFNLDMTFSNSCATTVGSVGSLLSCSPFHWSGGIGNNDLTVCGCAGPIVGLSFDITE